MITEERKKSSLLSLDTLERVGLTAAFCFFMYLIWSSSSALESELNATTDKFALVHNLQVEYKNEIQEWKNLLLRSTNQNSLEQNWHTYEKQHQKVAEAVKQGILNNDVRAINVKLQAFLDAHNANFLAYRKSSEILAKKNFDPRQVDANVKGIDRPLLEILEAGDAEMQDEKFRVNGRLIAKSNNRIEQSLIAIFMLMLIAIWRPRH